MNSFMRPAVQKDIELVQPPTESVSKIAFSPTQDILAVGSWDNNVSERGEQNVTWILACVCAVKLLKYPELIDTPRI